MERRPSTKRTLPSQHQPHDTFDRARDEYSRHHAELEHDARLEPRGADQPSDFRKRMEEALKRSGKDHPDKK